LKLTNSLLNIQQGLASLERKTKQTINQLVFCSF
jgi:hypothetical protein